MSVEVNENDQPAILDKKQKILQASKKIGKVRNTDSSKQPLGEVTNQIKKCETVQRSLRSNKVFLEDGTKLTKEFVRSFH